MEKCDQESGEQRYAIWGGQQFRGQEKKKRKSIEGGTKKGATYLQKEGSSSTLKCGNACRQSELCKCIRRGFVVWESCDWVCREEKRFS